jgi:hypothetical protein
VAWTMARRDVAEAGERWARPVWPKLKKMIFMNFESIFRIDSRFGIQIQGEFEFRRTWKFFLNSSKLF